MLGQQKIWREPVRVETGRILEWRYEGKKHRKCINLTFRYLLQLILLSQHLLNVGCMRFCWSSWVLWFSRRCMRFSRSKLVGNTCYHEKVENAYGRRRWAGESTFFVGLAWELRTFGARPCIKRVKLSRLHFFPYMASALVDFPKKSAVGWWNSCTRCL